MSIHLMTLILRKWNVFVSYEVQFPAKSDWRSSVAEKFTEWEVKTIEFSKPASGVEHWAFLDLPNLSSENHTKIKKLLIVHYMSLKVISFCCCCEFQGWWEAYAWKMGKALFSQLTQLPKTFVLYWAKTYFPNFSSLMLGKSLLYAG